MSNQELEELTHAAAQVLSIPQYNLDTFTELLKDAYRLGQKAMQSKGGKANTPAQQALRAANLAAMNTPEALAARTAKRRANKERKTLEMKP